MIDVIAFDADDTLWHNETLYAMTQEKFSELLASYNEPEIIQDRLYATERRNLGLFGYGIKGFTLSMIETAIEMTDGQICGAEIQSIIEFAKDMLRAPVRPMDGVEGVLQRLSGQYRLMLITKGDLFDQETKIAHSHLADYFDVVEIVSEKSEDVYRQLMDKHHVESSRFMMVGNSLRSDILPVLAIGGQAVHIPYAVTWQHEVTESQISEYEYFELDNIDQLPDLLSGIEANSTVAD